MPWKPEDSPQEIEGQQRKVECFWGTFPCKKGHTIEIQNFCDNGGHAGILRKFCKPFTQMVNCNGRTIGHQMTETLSNQIPKEEFCNDVKICDAGNDHKIWTDEVLDNGGFSYKFCKSNKFGVIFEKVN